MAEDLPVIEQSVQKTRLWTRQLAEGLGRPDDLHYAFRVLRAFFHTLRDRLPLEEAVHLAAQLPELLRGVYYEGWRPDTTPMLYHDRGTFLSLLADEGRLAGETEAAFAAEAAALVMRTNLTPGELDKVSKALPGEIAQLLRKVEAKS